MSFLTFWRESSPVSIHFHADAAVLLSTAQYSVDVPIHSHYDHRDVMVVREGRNGTTYTNITAEKKKNLEIKED